MSITILEAMKLDRFKDFKLIAGQTGIENKIEKVGILDWEFDIKIEGQFGKGEFLVSSLLGAKDNVKLLAAVLKELVACGVCGLAIKNIYYKALPEEILEYANEQHFPIFIFDNSVFFEDIITDILSAIRDNDNYQLFETKIDLILNKKISKAMIKELALEINNSFKENIIVAYCKEKRYIDDGNIIRLLADRKRRKAIKKNGALFKYKDGILAVESYETAAEANASSFSNTVFDHLGTGANGYYLGISDVYTNLNELDHAVNESLYAEKTAEITENSVLNYKDIGIYKLIMPCMDELFVHDFYKTIILPLKNYDEKYHTEILNTAIEYVNNDGNVKRTSEKLFQHDNTIRYRINKMKEILKMEKLEGGFYEQLSMAVKIYAAIDKGLWKKQ